MERRILMKCSAPREELVSAWQILESVKRNNRLSMRTQWEQSQEF